VIARLAGDEIRPHDSLLGRQSTLCTVAEKRVFLTVLTFATVASSCVWRFEIGEARTTLEHPETVRAFLRGLIAGMRDTQADPKGAFAEVLRIVPEAAKTADVQQQVLAATIDLSGRICASCPALVTALRSSGRRSSAPWCSDSSVWAPRTNLDFPFIHRQNRQVPTCPNAVGKFLTDLRRNVRNTTGGFLVTREACEAWTLLSYRVGSAAPSQ